MPRHQPQLIDDLCYRYLPVGQVTPASQRIQRSPDALESHSVHANESSSGRRPPADEPRCEPARNPTAGRVNHQGPEHPGNGGYREVRIRTPLWLNGFGR